jgi:hypothetical protein
LQAYADAVFELLALRAGIDPENRDLASTAWTEAFENFDRGGLAGAVRAEKSEDLARADFKVDSLDGFKTAVVFLQSGNSDDRILDWAAYARSLARGASTKRW